MMMVALLMRAWAQIMKSMNVHPSLLVDDILIIANGGKMADDFKKAMDKTHEYLKDMGAAIAPGKSLLFGSNAKIRRALKKHIWKGVGVAIKVVLHTRDLGAHLNLTRSQNASLAKDRIADTISRVRMIIAMNMPTHHPAQPLIAMTMPLNTQYRR